MQFAESVEDFGAGEVARAAQLIYNQSEIEITIYTLPVNHFRVNSFASMVKKTKTLILTIHRKPQRSITNIFKVVMLLTFRSSVIMQLQIGNPFHYECLEGMIDQYHD